MNASVHDHFLDSRPRKLMEGGKPLDEIARILAPRKPAGPFAWIAGFILSLPALGLVFVVLNWYRLPTWTKTEAVVTEKKVSKTSRQTSHYLRFSFYAEDGQYSVVDSVEPALFDRLKVGDGLEILYDPQSPVGAIPLANSGFWQFCNQSNLFLVAPLALWMGLSLLVESVRQDRRFELWARGKLQPMILISAKPGKNGRVLLRLTLEKDGPVHQVYRKLESPPPEGARMWAMYRDAENFEVL